MRNSPKWLTLVLATLSFASGSAIAAPPCPPHSHWDATATPPKCICEAGYHWDDMGGGMCMEDEGPVECPKDMHWSVEEDQCVPNRCGPGEYWDVPMKMCMPKLATGPGQCRTGEHWDVTMNMCMPDGDTELGVHVNQFMIGLSGSGPRGRTEFSAPNMFMTTFKQRISKCDSVKVVWMGTTDKWTVPENGTPELLQVGESNKQGVPYIDAQHPHTSPIMGLTFAEVHCFGKGGKNTFTLSFAPRGEATAGPVAFMHRPSADGNPNAPLAHHLQDVFHIMSTVLAAKVEIGKWTIEGSVFSGAEPSPSEVNLDMHRPDSGGIRVNKRVGNHVTVGLSMANVLETHRAEPGHPAEEPSRNTLLSAWVYTQHKLRRGTLSTSTIVGQANEEDEQLTSFLEELSYRFGKLEKNRVFSRIEVLQRTPEQLQIHLVGDANDPAWIKAFTLGYERALPIKKGPTVFLGGSATQAFVPNEFKASYGGNPASGEIHLRVLFMKNRSWNKRAKGTHH